jgi:hypothetical protein
MESNFDKQIKAKLERAEVAPSNELWAKLEGKLDAFEKPIEEPKSTRKIFWNVGVAAAVTSIAAMFSFLLWHTTEPNNSGVQAKLPIQKTDVKIGEEVAPSVNVVTVAAVKSETKPTAKQKPHPVTKQETKFEPDNSLAENSEVKTDVEDFQTPVYSLKLNSKRISPSLNEKITIISGEPKKVEIDENINTKQVIIYNRLQLINQSKHLTSKPEKE